MQPIPPTYPSRGRPSPASVRKFAKADSMTHSDAENMYVPDRPKAHAFARMYEALDASYGEQTDAEGERSEQVKQLDPIESEELEIGSLLSPSGSESELTFSDSEEEYPKPPQLPNLASIDGCWKVCASSYTLGAKQVQVSTWLKRLCIDKLRVRDGCGQVVPLKILDGKPYLEGGRLCLDSTGVLHRFGKSGSHLTFRRNQRRCLVHSPESCYEDHKR